MNRFNATITHIESEGILHVVTFDFGGISLRMMSLELDNEIRVGANVILTIKSTYIALAKEFEGRVSYTNIIPARITKINNGKLLCSVQLEVNSFVLESIITADSSDYMMLKEGDEVKMLIKASELSIVEVMNG